METSIQNTNFRKEGAAAYTGMSLSTFNKLYKEKKIPGYKVSPKIIYFKKEDLDKLLQAFGTVEQNRLVTENI